MLLYELHSPQLDEDISERLAKAVVMTAMALAAGAVALGFATNDQHDVEAETQRLISQASAVQVARIRDALVKRSKEDLKRELDSLRREAKAESR